MSIEPEVWSKSEAIVVGQKGGFPEFPESASGAFGGIDLRPRRRRNSAVGFRKGGPSRHPISSLYLGIKPLEPRSAESKRHAKARAGSLVHTLNCTYRPSTESNTLSMILDHVASAAIT